MSEIKYRSDIDGLRAVAIIPVVFFHVGYEFFKGGYVGVDVFFVISGYLITTILLNSMNNGTYSLLEFYERRIRRIIPTLICVMVFILVASPFFLTPDNYYFLPKEIIGTLLFSSNIVSWLKSDYFSNNSEQRPLLHTWSLGIEEQFYIIFPVLIILTFKYFKKHLKHILLITTIISFALSAYFTSSHISGAFYMLPTRYWELSFGALIAAGFFVKPKSKPLNETLSIIGVILITYSITSFTSSDIFPGYIAIVPVLGATLLILSAEETLIGNVLSSKPLVLIGSISYSLYLWHWPLIVFSRDKYIINTHLGNFGVIALSFLLAWLSTKFIESKFRNKTKYTRKKIFTYAIYSYLVIFFISILVLTLKGWPKRLSDGQLDVLKSAHDYSPTRVKCHFNKGIPDPSSYCILGDEMKTTNTIVWGDSHGAEISNSLSKYSRLYAVTYSACPPAIGYNPDDRPECLTHNKNVITFILNKKNIKTVILAANYNLYDKNNKSNEFYNDFQKTISLLLKSGKRVLVLDQIPSPGVDIPNTLANSRVLINKTFKYNSKSFDKVKLAPNAQVFHYEKNLCSELVCNMIYKGYPISFDDNHLSMHTANSLAQVIQNQLINSVEVIDLSQ
ncbi:acyltransferase family protein [Ewingella sp. S1.OA.A_B6]